jgi:hypothetical protein
MVPVTTVVIVTPLVTVTTLVTVTPVAMVALSLAFFALRSLATVPLIRLVGGVDVVVGRHGAPGHREYERERDADIGIAQMPSYR